MGDDPNQDWPVSADGGPASVFVCGADALARAEIAEVARAIGLPAEAVGLDADGIARFGRAGPGDILVAELGGCPAGLFDDALSALRRRADRGLPVIVAVPLDRIDAVMGEFGGGDVPILCQPTPGDIAAALVGARGRPFPAVAEGKADELYPQLQNLAEQMAQVARALAQLSQGGQPGADGVSAHALAFRAAPRTEPDVDAAYVRAIIRGRRLRDNYFPAELFADPAWDMLLDLMAARLEGSDVAVSSLCIAAAVPPTTALRWIKTLTDSGLFVRIADPHDGRRVFITLSDAAAAGMLNYLAAARRIASPVA
ncbi:hypothetical protein [Sphingomonas fennica]|uniref:MarR family transcriptional regulator n=1 Tax=Edaphosphingomonas fennica TaxID=114404 RepID=A0A2T4I681_9SPHN|nr:hypothetical protein [Sphingomonas fennica]PTD26138.1 hypothetical protein CV103_03805 [Sphingomonas fennica]